MRVCRSGRRVSYGPLPSGRERAENAAMDFVQNPTKYNDSGVECREAWDIPVTQSRNFYSACVSIRQKLGQLDQDLDEPNPSPTPTAAASSNSSTSTTTNATPAPEQTPAANATNDSPAATAKAEANKRDSCRWCVSEYSQERDAAEAKKTSISRGSVKIQREVLHPTLTLTLTLTLTRTRTLTLTHNPPQS